MKQTAEVRAYYQSSPPSLSVYDEARMRTRSHTLVPTARRTACQEETNVNGN